MLFAKIAAENNVDGRVIQLHRFPSVDRLRKAWVRRIKLINLITCTNGILISDCALNISLTERRKEMKFRHCLDRKHLKVTR